MRQIVPQDLHIHTVFSEHDSAVVPQQTPELVYHVNHAKIIGISDHFEDITTKNYAAYSDEVRKFGFRLGTEVDGHESVEEAASLEFDYYVYHCRDNEFDYVGIDVLRSTGKPVIIAHPYVFNTSLNRIPDDCFVELNNRYIWRFDWENYLKDFIHKFRFVISSDAHQPNWLNQNVARYVAEQLGIKETLVFAKEPAGLLSV